MGPYIDGFDDIEVFSEDDPWIDRPSYWSFAEHATILALVQSVIGLKSPTKDAIRVQVIPDRGRGERRAGVSLFVNEQSNVSRAKLEKIADALCRLIRPQRYSPDKAGNMAFGPLFSEYIPDQNTTAHERMASWGRIREYARDLDRTEEGIDAALSILSEPET